MNKRLRIALVAISGSASILATATPAAAAGTKCIGLYGSSQVEACVTVGPYGGTFATLQAYSGGFGDYVLAVEECRTDLTNCITFSAQSYPYGGVTYATTSSKNCAFGHIYRTHATWTDSSSGQRFVDARTAFSAC
jgi:hypothetical protein